MSDSFYRVLELLVLGVPLWGSFIGAIRFFFILREFPPHLHDNGTIRYARGWEPGKIVKIDFGGK